MEHVHSLCYHKLLLLTNITMGLNMAKNRAESTTFLLVVESIIKLANSFTIQTRNVQGMCSTLWMFFSFWKQYWSWKGLPVHVLIQYLKISIKEQKAVWVYQLQWGQVHWCVHQHRINTVWIFREAEKKIYCLVKSLLGTTEWLSFNIRCEVVM